VWALVGADQADGFVEGWRAAYAEAHPGRADTAEFFRTAPGPAARILKP